ncbi:MAG TPA: hypothetical protein VD913_04950, partial [bacterium]|nr:hypothetical protein [bacterium]
MHQTDSPLVILIQDAHAIPEAQRHIQRLIEHFQSQYGVHLVATEGASSELDPRIFNSFPDKKLLKRTFEEYMDKGELAGSAAAAIFSEAPAIYQGIEDWSLYEEGIGLYLRAMAKEGEISDKLQAARDRLQKEKERTHSKDLLEIDGMLEQFRKNQVDLATVLKKLDVVKKGASRKLLPVPFSIKTLLEEIKQDGKENAEIEQEVSEIAEKIQTVSDTLLVSDTAEFNQKYQAFRTSKIGAGEFAVFLKELAEKRTGNNSLPVPFSQHLLQQMQQHKRLRDMEGTQFFREFEAYARSVKESLFRNDAEKALDQESRRLYLIEKLAKLELGREEWEEVRNTLFVKREADLKEHFAFYRNAEKREKAFLRNLEALRLKHASRDTLDVSILVAGGFHTEGLAKQFKEEGISYVVVRPQIGSIPEKSFYRAHMRGDVSWKEYFRIENGKVNLYEAFVRGTRDRLLMRQETRDKRQENPKERNSHLVSSVSRLLLKAWRDQIIRDLAQKEQISKVPEYTKYLDELMTKDETRNAGNALFPILNTGDEVRKQWFSKINRFVSGLRRLQSSGRLTEKNILELLKPSTIPSAVVSAAAFPRSDIRAELIRGTHDSMRFAREKSGRSLNTRDDFGQPRRAEVRSFENQNQPDHDQIIFATQEGMEESTSNLKKISSFTGSYRFEDIDDFDTFDERFPDVWYLMKDWPNGYELFITFGELIYNALQASKDNDESVQV